MKKQNKKNFTMVENEVVRSKVFKNHSVFRLYVFLKSFTSPVFLSQDKIKNLTGLAGSTQALAQKELKRIGALQVKRGGQRNGLNVCNTYTLFDVENWVLNEEDRKQFNKALKPLSRALETPKIKYQVMQNSNNDTSKIEDQVHRKSSTNNTKVNNTNNNNTSKALASFLNSNSFRDFKNSRKFSKEEKRKIKIFLAACMDALDGRKYFSSLPKIYEEFIEENGNLFPPSAFKSLFIFYFKGQKGKDIARRIYEVIDETYKLNLQVADNSEKINSNHRILNKIRKNK